MTLCLILLVAAGLRFHGLPQLGFWTDELFTLSDSNGWGLQPAHLQSTGLLPPGQVHYTRRSDARHWRELFAELGRSEIHPPLYFAMLRAWEDLFGADDEVTVRSLNVVLSLAAIVLLYAALQEQQHPPGVALWACAIMAVAGPQIEYAQEARDYMPLVTFSLAAAVPLLRIEGRGVSVARLVSLGLALLALMLTNYFAVTLVVALGLYVLLQFRGVRLGATLLSFAAAGVVYAGVWGPFLLRQAPRFVGGHTWLVVAGPGRVSREWSALLTLPARFLFEPGRSGGLVGLSPWLTVLWLLLIPGLLRRTTRLWAMWVIVPVLIVTTSDLRESMTQLAVIRFTLAATPGFYVLIAAATEPLTTARGSREPGARRALIPGICLLSALWALPRAYTPPWKLDFRTPASFLNARLNPTHDALVFIGPPEDSVWTAVALNGIRHYLHRDPAMLVVLQHPAAVELLDRLSLCPTVWVIARPLRAPLGDYLPGYRTLEEGNVPSFIDVLRGVVGRTTTAPAPPPESNRPR